MTSKIVYVVTIFGCNSTPSDMWIPQSKYFANYEDAYSYFLKVSPSLDDKHNKADQYINIGYEEMTDEYLIIEHRVQNAGYHDGDMNCAKRPQGALIARVII